MRDHLYRARLLILACIAALGGAVGAAGRASWLWVVTPGAALCLAAIVARKRGGKIAWAASLPALPLCRPLYGPYPIR